MIFFDRRMSQTNELPCHWCVGYPTDLSRSRILFNGGKTFLAREYLAHMRSNCIFAIQQREAQQNRTSILSEARKLPTPPLAIVLKMLQRNQLKINEPKK